MKKLSTEEGSSQENPGVRKRNRAAMDFREIRAYCEEEVDETGPDLYIIEGL
jgi:hypothetical protein